MDRDIGYGVLRMSRDQDWNPYYLGSLALRDRADAAVRVGRHAARPRSRQPDRRQAQVVRRQASGQRACGARPASRHSRLHRVPGPDRPAVRVHLLGNATANIVRNIWAYSIIFCGHFPTGTQTFTRRSARNETRGQWYLRQMLGSANIDGGTLFHIMSGNLSHQIEHHLFPTSPASRYPAMAVEVREICERYGLPTHRLVPASAVVDLDQDRQAVDAQLLDPRRRRHRRQHRTQEGSRSLIGLRHRSQPPSTAPARRGGGRYRRDTGIIEEGLTWSTASNATGHDPGTGRIHRRPRGLDHHHHHQGRRRRRQEVGDIITDGFGCVRPRNWPNRTSRAALSTPTTPNSTTTPMSPVPTPRTPRRPRIPSRYPPSTPRSSTRPPSTYRPSSNNHADHNAVVPAPPS